MMWNIIMGTLCGVCTFDQCHIMANSSLPDFRIADDAKRRQSDGGLVALRYTFILIRLGPLARCHRFATILTHRIYLMFLFII